MEITTSSGMQFFNFVVYFTVFLIIALIAALLVFVIMKIIDLKRKFEFEDYCVEEEGSRAK